MNTQLSVISQHDLLDSSATKVKLAEAAKSGIFYLEIPANCSLALEKTIAFANEHYTNPEIRNLKLEGLSGFHQRTNCQVESLWLERKYWNIPELPRESEVLAKEMLHSCLQIMKVVFQIVGIPESEWKGEKGCIPQENHSFFSFNHYRPQISLVGLPQHRDFGLITMLFNQQAGLQARINGAWIDVPPLTNHFVVNFGLVLEVYVNDVTKLTAAWHRVQQQETERTSFGVFVNPREEAPIFQRRGCEEPRCLAQTYQKFVSDLIQNLY